MTASSWPACARALALLFASHGTVKPQTRSGAGAPRERAAQATTTTASIVNSAARRGARSRMMYGITGEYTKGRREVSRRPIRPRMSRAAAHGTLLCARVAHDAPLSNEIEGVYDSFRSEGPLLEAPVFHRRGNAALDLLTTGAIQGRRGDLGVFDAPGWRNRDLDLDHSTEAWIHTQAFGLVAALDFA